MNAPRWELVLKVSVTADSLVETVTKETSVQKTHSATDIAENVKADSSAAGTVTATGMMACSVAIAGMNHVEACLVEIIVEIPTEAACSAAVDMVDTVALAVDIMAAGTGAVTVAGIDQSEPA